MQILRTFVLSLIIIMFYGVLAPHSYAATAPQSGISGTVTLQNSTPSVITKDAIVLKINKARKDQGLPALRVDPLLAKAAQKKANDMMLREYFSHYTPDGIPFYTLIRKAGYNYTSVAENLAVNYKSASGVVSAWLLSPAHRINVLSTLYKETGIGLAYGTYKGTKSWYIVELFGTERKLK